MINFSIYVHIPFCLKKCGYCDFYSYKSVCLEQEANEYTELILDQIESSKIAGSVDNIFFGGGTPTLLPACEVQKILSEIKKKWSVSKTAEITIEANPDTITEKRLEFYKRIGINRISIGAQSFDAKILEFLDRTHNVDNVFSGVALANELGFRTSVDLIYGAPIETLKSWQKTVETAIKLGTKHISIYALELHKNTPLYKKCLRQGLSIDQDLTAKKYYLASKLLQKNGFECYEISNFAKSSSGNNGAIDISRHNWNYWQTDGQWLGLGINAHSKIGNKRFYVNSANEKIVDTPTESEQRTENIMLSLRTYKGIDCKLVEHKNVEVTEFIKQGLIYKKGSRIIVTDKGKMLLDIVIRKLI